MNLFTRRTRTAALGLALAAPCAHAAIVVDEPKPAPATTELKAEQYLKYVAEKAGEQSQNPYLEYRNDVQPNPTTEFYSVVLNDPADESLGATLQPLSEPLRAQLKSLVSSGLLVAELAQGGPAEQAGLKVHDILLSLADKPIKSAEEFKTILKEAGEKELDLVVLRRGAKQTIKVRPVFSVTLGPAAKEPAAADYYLGVNLSEVDDALAEQVGRGESHGRPKGLLIAHVIANSPAEKAGVKVNDILLEFAGEPISNQPQLSKRVGGNKGAPVKVKVLREGRETVVTVTPEPRPQENANQVVAREKLLRLYQPSVVTNELLKRRMLNRQGYLANSTLNLTPTLGAPQQFPANADPRIAALQAEIQQLKASIEALKAEKSGDRK
ncbi:MAG: PDZ domain-containing protein [Isosphaeraceae bacterium]